MTSAIPSRCSVHSEPWRAPVSERKAPEVRSIEVAVHLDALHLIFLLSLDMEASLRDLHVFEGSNATDLVHNALWRPV